MNENAKVERFTILDKRIIWSDFIEEVMPALDICEPYDDGARMSFVMQQKKLGKD